MMLKTCWWKYNVRQKVIDENERLRAQELAQNAIEKTAQNTADRNIQISHDNNVKCAAIIESHRLELIDSKEQQKL